MKGEDEMTRLLYVILALVATLLVVEIPEIRRYAKMKRM